MVKSRVMPSKIAAEKPYKLQFQGIHSPLLQNTLTCCQHPCPLTCKRAGAVACSTAKGLAKTWHHRLQRRAQRRAQL